MVSKANKTNKTRMRISAWNTSNRLSTIASVGGYDAMAEEAEECTGVEEVVEYDGKDAGVW